MKKITAITSGIAAVTLVLGVLQAQGQSVLFNFSDSTADGWANAGFSGTPVATVSNIGGQNYISLPIGGYQVGNVASDSSGVLAGFNAAMAAAFNDPTGYQLTYNYYIATSTFTTPGTFLQVASFVNTGSGFYGSTGTPSSYEPALNGTQLASGDMFSGTATIPFTAFGTDASAATETYFRMGLIINGDGTAGVKVNFTDISIAPAPEPSTFALIGLGAAATMLMLRRRMA